MAYPDSTLPTGVKDSPYGGAAANRFGTKARKFIDSVLQAAEDALLQIYWKPYNQHKMKIASGAVLGDLVFENLVSSESDYTLSTIAGLTAAGVAYSADSSPRVGLIAEPVSAGAKALVITEGPGIPPSIHGLGAGTAGYVVMNTTTGRLQRQDETPLYYTSLVVGTVNNKGTVRLFPRDGVTE